jgi:hypothetical protein
MALWQLVKSNWYEGLYLTWEEWMEVIGVRKDDQMEKYTDQAVAVLDLTKEDNIKHLLSTFPDNHGVVQKLLELYPDHPLVMAREDQLSSQNEHVLRVNNQRVDLQGIIFGQSQTFPQKNNSKFSGFTVRRITEYGCMLSGNIGVVDHVPGSQIQLVVIERESKATLCKDCKSSLPSGIWTPCGHKARCSACASKSHPDNEEEEEEEEEEEHDRNPSATCPICKTPALFVPEEVVSSSVAIRSDSA